MKKRVKGLLAFWLCMLMLLGSSMSVFAAEYKLSEINPGDIFVTGDIIDSEGVYSSGSVYYVDIDKSTTFDNDNDSQKNSHIIEKGNWQYIGSSYNDEWWGWVFKAVEAEEKENRSVYRCDHDMQYEIYREPTEEVDGLWRYGCTKCTHTEGFVSICGMGAFFERAINTINGAEVNGTVTIATPKWMSFNKDVYDALAARPDVTVNVHFRYQGQFYAVTIPAGTDLTPYLTEDGYCGFLKLAALFGVTAIQTEE